MSANFFRTRDAIRQNLIDQSALGLALSRPPSMPAGSPVLAGLLPAGVLVDQSAILYEGVSLGSMLGTSVAATNPRVTRASFSVGGGTMVDVFTNAPAFKADVEALFATLIPGFTWEKVDPTNPAFDITVASAYLQLVNVAKWILDPADPINYASHLIDDPLPNLLSPTPALQAPKAIYGQIATNDVVVPNAFNGLLFSLIGAEITLYSDSSVPGGSVSHGIIGSSATVQGDAAGFLASPPVIPPVSRDLNGMP